MGTSTDHGIRDSAIRRRIIGELRSRPGEALTTAEVAELLQVYPSTARFHLDQLVYRHLIASDFERRGVGRPRKVYRLAADVPGTSSERHDAQPLRLLSGLLAEMVATPRDGKVATPLEAGQEWAHANVHPDAPTEPARAKKEWLAKIESLIKVLTTWGYSPTVTSSPRTRLADIELTHCPFRDLARANPEVVCAIHLGLIRGSMSALGEPGTRVELLPFVDGSNTCIAHLHDSRSTDAPSKES